jgi:NADPH:quinone reductase-like Zn-dependent oxidoreductase
MPRIVRFHQTGPADVLKIEETEIPQPGPGEVVLKVDAIGLNRAEVMFRSGQYMYPPKFPSSLGYEAAGTIAAVGPDVTQWKVGQKASAVPSFSLQDYGTYGDYVVLPVYALESYPDNLSAEEATSIWMQYLTAMGIVEIGKLQSDQWIVITAAASSVGLAAIQIARSIGARAIATTRNRDKVEALKSAGAELVIDTKEQDLVAVVNEVTKGAGVPLVFDPIAGPGVEQLAQATSGNGMVMLYGALAMAPTPLPLFPVVGKHLTIRGYTLFEIVGNPERRKEAVKFVYDHLKNETLRPIIAKVFKLDDIVEAHRYMESSEQIGKIVVVP